MPASERRGGRGEGEGEARARRVPLSGALQAAALVCCQAAAHNAPFKSRLASPQAERRRLQGHCRCSQGRQRRQASTGDGFREAVEACGEVTTSRCPQSASRAPVPSVRACGHSSRRAQRAFLRAERLKAVQPAARAAVSFDAQQRPSAFCHTPNRAPLLPLRHQAQAGVRAGLRAVGA